MPNTRRRRFSVQNDIGSRDSSKMQNNFHGSYQDIDESKLITNNSMSARSSRSKHKMIANGSRISSNLKIVTDTESCTSTGKLSSTTVDKNVAASSSTIDLLNLLNEECTPTDQSNDAICPKEAPPKSKDTRIANKDNIQRRDKVPRPHRIKVRSPRRRPPILDQKHDKREQRSVEIAPIDWDQEVEVEHVTNLVIVTNEDEPSRVSDHSLDDMCRICHSGEALSNELGQLISACSCRGTVGRVHIKCLERWLTESGKSRCELCGTRYITKRVHKYGVPRALLMWLLSQNAKQNAPYTLLSPRIFG
ncbi:unnamed protein product [Chilo suppressalis]|uniref:RING-CH-type domain-containing protein n=1 Tax=Chilo suppressalis TaxID=168631 RepID=A0ABN8L8D3_CHISP|nr:unnamed protein product [Chilo suppressalis]